MGSATSDASGRTQLGETLSALFRDLDVVPVAYLFGSRALGTARGDSDLDIAVAYDDGADSATRDRVRETIFARLAELLGALGERADIVDLHRKGSGVAFNALRTGVRLFARSERDRVLTETRVARRYDDDSPRRALFREAAVHAVKRMQGG